MSDWSELLDDLLVEIAKKMKLYKDFVSFRCVCRSWRSAANNKNYMYKSDEMPLLMLPPQQGTDEFGFFNLSEAKTRRVCLSENKDNKCFSSKGWLLTINCRNLRVSLLNPFSHARIELPNPMAFENWQYHLTHGGAYLFFDRFLLSSSNLLGSDYIIIVVYGNVKNLAYIRSGQKSWTTVKTEQIKSDDSKEHCGIWDLIYYKDKVYVINCRGTIFVCDFHGEDTNPTVAQVAAIMPDAIRAEIRFYRYYLVESDGALLVVSREDEMASGNHIYGTVGFRIFNVDLVTNTWIEIEDIGNKALFLGHNSSLSIQVPDFSICKPNCIYFTDDFVEGYCGKRRKGGGKDMGIYNIKDGSIIPYFTSKTRIRSRLAPPMWVEHPFN